METSRAVKMPLSPVREQLAEAAQELHALCLVLLGERLKEAQSPNVDVRKSGRVEDRRDLPARARLAREKLRDNAVHIGWHGVLVYDEPLTLRLVLPAVGAHRAEQRFAIVAQQLERHEPEGE